ncbi:hypothetical protein JRO89_XS15G0128900 [Xanthoceras sorbifolium]|uniref:F-box domain-containing protein n=1 Tax=Xanthoceras sorbifolium TaxID=99658 RepID=A0ABQ8H1X3_9ROSI|nr:hypothetical protein JRO89_XS15G0128900 [Xanthoceras sorbifolium]
METNQKTHKPENAQDNENSDRLSCLHDAILFHIFSFLPTIYVVQSNILSKRWKTLWNSLPYLDFDDESVTSAMGIEHSEETIRIKLTNVLNNFLLHRLLQYSEAWLLNHLPTFCNLKHLDLEVGSEDGDMVEAVA